MTKRDGLIGVLKDASCQNYYDAGVWLLYTGLGSLIPIIISVVILMVAGVNFGLVDFARHAEFGIYSAAILASCAYVVGKDLDKPFPCRQVFVLLIILAIIVATAFFASVSVFGKVEFLRDLFTVDAKFVTTCTVGLFFFSLVLGCLINLLDGVISNFDLQKAQKRQAKELETDFDGLGDNDG